MKKKENVDIGREKEKREIDICICRYIRRESESETNE